MRNFLAVTNTGIEKVLDRVWIGEELPFKYGQIDGK